MRGRLVGLPAHENRSQGETLERKPYLSEMDVAAAFRYFRARKELNEVILSGGDPLIAPQPYLTQIVTGLGQLQTEGTLDFVRLHTRAPITNPSVLKPWHFALVARLGNPFVVFHINHPAEITPEVQVLVKDFRSAGATVLSQSVLLKGVNDSLETLGELFLSLTRAGIRPYYLHHNDPVYWAADFTVPVKQAVHLWQTLRPRLSGIAATAKFVIDTPYGHGKVPFPEGRWEPDLTHFYDFKKRRRTLVNG